MSPLVGAFCMIRADSPLYRIVSPSSRHSFFIQARRERLLSSCMDRVGGAGGVNRMGGRVTVREATLMDRLPVMHA